MPRTIESILASHDAATERRKAGRRVWDFTVKIKHLFSGYDSDENAASVANQVAAILRARLPSSWLDFESDSWDSEISEIVEQLESLTPNSYDDDDTYGVLEDVNSLIDQLYDWADAKRVWIG